MPLLWGREKIQTVEKEEEEEEKFFLNHRSDPEEESITDHNAEYNPIRIFSAKELERATKNYDRRYQICRTGSHELYRGTHEGRPVLVKKFHAAIHREASINEVTILTQLYHENVLELIGYSSKTTNFPIHVYEFACSIGFLSDHIYIDDNDPSTPGNELLPWETRLRIVSKIADAVTYIHTAAGRPIIHANIKPSNILLDERYFPSLFGFESSIWIPLGETSVLLTTEDDATRHTTTAVMGAPGYVDPELILTSRLTEKSDVYSFENNNLAVKMKNGKRVIEISLPDDDAISNEAIHELILMSCLLKEGNRNQMLACAALSLRCTKRNPEERPTMEEVAQQLGQIRKF
ncbi:PREDICTED: wall-associated receptor kinase-like 22 [Nelumbo nucifera]|uniref:Wall-associated receptor kinase-like 22 n=1 Tax=Nelumbo nucifera TaxID=4432 RepID=A0A1U8PZS3_NELNU|nr:PREDICTED: wall-associated receptor kinase-like 22 [Nelumbo nucifera]